MVVVVYLQALGVVKYITIGSVYDVGVWVLISTCRRVETVVCVITDVV